MARLQARAVEQQRLGQGQGQRAVPFRRLWARPGLVQARLQRVALVLERV